MIIYLFYLCLDKIKVGEYPGVHADTIRAHKDGYEYSLYAFTPMKKIAKYFKDTRDMNIFYPKTIELDREDYDDFCEDHSQYLLEFHSVETTTVVDGRYKAGSTEILMTLTESDEILYHAFAAYVNMMEKNFSDNGGIILNVLQNQLLKKQVMRALNKAYMITWIMTFLFLPVDDSDLEGIIIDRLSLYIELFKNTYKKKGSK